MNFHLCGSGHCPIIKRTEEGVEIGEKGNKVKLKPSEWNALVEGIEEGKIGKI